MRMQDQHHSYKSAVFLYEILHFSPMQNLRARTRYLALPNQPAHSAQAP